MSNDKKKIKDKKIAIKRIKTSFERKKIERGQQKILNWRAKLKKRIELTNESKIKNQRRRVKLKKKVKIKIMNLSMKLKKKSDKRNRNQN